jgi:hypothetical protein
VNFFFGGMGIAYSPTFQPFVDSTVSNRSQVLNVAPDTVISSEAGSRTLAEEVADAVYGGSGRSNGSPGSSHFDIPSVNADPLYSGFVSGVSGYIAFVLNPGTGEHFGWMRVTLKNDGTPGIIHEWAYSDQSSFQVAQIPEPAAAGMVLLAAGGLALRPATGNAPVLADGPDPPGIRAGSRGAARPCGADLRAAGPGPVASRCPSPGCSRRPRATHGPGAPRWRPARPPHRLGAWTRR